MEQDGEPEKTQVKEERAEEAEQEGLQEALEAELEKNFPDVVEARARAAMSKQKILLKCCC